MIEVNNVTKQYGDKLAANDISFQVGEGEIVGLLGPNGAGKSTIMKIITGFIPPTSGTVVVDGHDVTSEPKETAKKIGFLPEIPPLYPDMKVLGYLMFMADIKSVPKEGRTAHVADVMKMTGIEDVSGRLIKNLSKGYRQRVGLAQALLALPPILILDEPTVGLDPKQRTELRNLIVKLSEKHTIILSSHILAEVSMVCEKIIILNQGEIIAVDSTKSLEQSIESADKFSIKTKGEKEKATALLEGIGCIVKTEEIMSEDDVHTISASKSVGDESSDELREKVFYAFAKADMPILELRTTGMSLEEIFLELTRQDVKKQEDES